MSFQTPLTINEVITKIHAKKYLLPSIQREFVWDTNQIIMLFDSLMRDYPINALDDNVVANEAQGVSKKVAGQRLTMILIRQWTVKTGTRFMVFIYKILHSDGLQVCFQ